MLLIEATSADQVWRTALHELGKQTHQLQTGRREATIELLHVAIGLSNPLDRWVTSRYPPLNPAFAIAELVWMLNGNDDSAFLNYWNSRLPLFAGHGITYRGAYGYRLRKHFAVDQLEKSASMLAHNPDTRQVVLQIWDGTIDLPDAMGQPSDADIPCNLMSILKVRDGRLEWLQVLRSNDLFLGLPYNLLQFTTLQEVVAGWIGVGVGTYNQISDSLHIYKSDIEQAFQASEEPPARNTDSLAHPMLESQRALKELDESSRFMTRDRITKTSLRRRVIEFAGPLSYRNWLSVLAAEAARKRGWLQLTNDFAHEITNPALQQQWALWMSRIDRRNSSSTRTATN
jgi:thymidylate synthase